MILTSHTCRSCRRARGCWRGSQKRPWSFVYRRQAPRSPLHPPSSWSSTSAHACPPTGVDTKASRTLQTKSGNGENKTFNKGHPRVCEAAGLRLLRAPALRKVWKRYSEHSRSKVSKRTNSSGNCHPGVCVTLASSTPCARLALATGMSGQQVERTRLKSRKAKQRIMTPITGHPCVRKADSLPLVRAPALRQVWRNC